MSFLALNVPFQKTAGLCNQLYNIVQTTIFGIKNNWSFFVIFEYFEIMSFTIIEENENNVKLKRKADDSEKAFTELWMKHRKK